MGLVDSAVRAGARAAVDAARTGEMAAIRQRAARAAQGLPREEPATVRPGAAGVVAVPENAAPELRAPGTVATTDTARIDGARVLEQGYGWLQHMAYWDNPWVTVAATLYAAAAHARDPEQDNALVWLTMPRVFYTGDPNNVEGGEGKSVKARYTAALCPDPQRVTEMTKAYLISQMAKRKTIVVTELDNVVGASGRRNAWLPGLANVGFEFDGATGRKQDRQDVDIPLFGAFILDGKAFIMHTAGPALGPLWSRCLVLRSQRAPAGYVAPRYNREMRSHAVVLRSRFARWMAQEVADGIADHQPQIPEGLGNRPLDLWWNFFCVAERAGGIWPELAREACKRVESVSGVPEQDAADDAVITARQRDWQVSLPSLPSVASDDGWED